MKIKMKVMEENRCYDCKFFKFLQKPKLSWKERFDLAKKNHPTLSDEEATVLADSHNIWDTIKGDLGKCGNKNLPELRDVEFNAKIFGCIYFKKGK